MDKNRSHLTDRILQLTLEIIYLLTGEVYVSLTKSDDHVTPSSHPHMSRDLRSQSPFLDPPPPSLTPERKKKVLEVTQKIIELLAGEVPIRCQDVSVYFSMEEWEYLEGHLDLYKDVVMEDRPPLTSPDGSRNRNPPERCPTASEDLRCYKHYSENEELNIVIANIDQETQGQRMDVKIKEEERSPGISTVTDHNQNSFISSQKTDLYADGSVGHLVFSKVDHHAETSLGEQKGFEHKNSSSRTHFPGHHNDNGVFHSTSDTMDFNANRSADHLEFIKPFHCPLDKPKGRFPCPECGKRFNSNSYLVIHQMIHTGQKPFTCPDCQKCFRQKSELTVHKRIHTGEKPFSCIACGKFFRQKSYLIVHQRIHTGEKPYSCPDCGKCFISSTYLASHQRNHRGEKAFVCSQCGKSFRHRAGLVSHQITHTGQKSFGCLQCEKTFRQRSGLVAHQKTHLGLKPFSCSQCEKSFYSQAKMKEHYKIHTGHKPYECLDCAKCFSQRSQLVSHQKIHSHDKPYACPECKKCFKRSTHLIKHQRVHRKEALLAT